MKEFNCDKVMEQIKCENKEQIVCTPEKNRYGTSQFGIHNYRTCVDFMTGKVAFYKDIQIAHKGHRLKLVWEWDDENGNRIGQSTHSGCYNARYPYNSPIEFQCDYLIGRTNIKVTFYAISQQLNGWCPRIDNNK